MRVQEPDYRHLVSIPPGPHLLSDAIVSSAVLFDPDRPGAGAGASGSGSGEAGGDEASMLADLEQTDPELAMVRDILLPLCRC